MNLNELKARFDRDGFVHLENAIDSAELAELRNETGRMIEAGWRGKEPSRHYFHTPDPHTGEDELHRVQFIFSKAEQQPNPFLALLGHPRLLDIVAKIHEGFHSCICGEALVFKSPRNGREVPVHCDGAEGRPDLPPREVFFNIDVYLDHSTPENGCLLAVPGSHLRPANELIRREGFKTPGLIPVPAKAGDVIIHNTRVIHGSHASRSASLRRTIYYEFRTLEWISTPGHAEYMGLSGRDMTAWIKARAQLLQHAIELRKTCAYGAGEAETTFRIPERWIANGELDLSPTFGGCYF